MRMGDGMSLENVPLTVELAGKIIGGLGSAFGIGWLARSYFVGTALRDAKAAAALARGLAEDQRSKYQQCDKNSRLMQDELAKLRVRLGDPDIPVDADNTTDTEDDLWGRPYADLPAHVRAMARSKPRVISVGNLKGGVGKTTIAANLAAYFDKTRGKRVLLIDLDYQGSLSATCLQAAKIEGLVSLADELIDGRADGSWVVKVAKQLQPALSKTWIIPAGYSLAQTESKLMLRWYSGRVPQDIRFNLAKVLLSPEVQDTFEVIIIDIGPRLTTAAINALAASTHLIVPTVLDRLSTETVSSFLNRAKALKQDLNPSLSLAGVVGTMTAEEPRLKNTELASMVDIKRALEQWNGESYVFDRWLPRRQAFADAAGRDIAYLKNNNVADLFKELGDEVAQRIGL